MPSSWRWFIVFVLTILCVTRSCTSLNIRGCPAQEIILPCRCILRGGIEYQIWCSHSDLPRILQAFKIIGQYIFQPIDELILENNNLLSLPGKAFLPLQVMRVMLRHNGLERLSIGWLSGQEKTLMELFIVEPALRGLPEESLGNLVQLEAVTLQSNAMKHLPNFSRLPKLRYIQIESSSLLELSPIHFQELPSLEKFHVGGSPRLTRLEAGLLQDLPLLTLVNISNCGISWIHPRSISRLPLLSELSLTGNRIKDAGMVGRAAKDLPALSVLRIDRNIIEIIGEAAFVDLPELSKLFISNNRITELQFGAFHRVPMLRILNLNNNLIRRIHPESFLQHSGSGLEELWMVNNDIGHVAEVRALLDALPRLTFLDISYNNLETIPFGALRGHPTLERFHLDHNRIHLIGREAFAAMPSLRELRLRNNSLSDLIDAPMYNLPALKGLDLSGNYYKKIEPRLLDNLPSLRKVDLSGNEITFIDPMTFIRTPAVEHVNLSHNIISNLHPATFRSLHNLYELDISHNRLVEFVPGLPRGIEYLHLSRNQIHIFPHPPSPDLDLPGLRSLDISANGIQRMPPTAMRSLPQLRRLILSRNSLQYLEEKALDGLSRLELLDLQDNRIVQLHPNSLRDVPELRKLNLRENRLNVLEPQLFQNIPRLEMLDIAWNKLNELVPGIFERTREIQVIDASHNTLIELPKSVYGMKKLRMLDLASNRLKFMDPDILGSLTALTDLRLSFNLLQELKRGVISNLQQLKTLSLDNNEIEIVEPTAIAALPLLKTLKMSQNKLRELPSQAFSNLPKLQVAELQENSLKYIAPDAFHLIPQLLVLNVSYNQLPGFEEAGLRNIRSLEMLDVSNNKISRVISSSLENMEWLVELRMDDNLICAVHGAPFDGMPRLRVLSMRNNKMMSFPERIIHKIKGNLAILDVDGNPLACSCSLLWMHSWLQESSALGPRCVDGSLLREMRLSRHQCTKDDIAAEPVAPGCEAELLSAPGLAFGTSQVFSPFERLKDNSTKTVHVKNNLPPSPEESEYFYNDFIDYPFNESAVIAELNASNTKLNNLEASTAKSSHYISGDTPTIYAATKNKTKSPPKVVSGSPSSSGFTFFGIPLTGLNSLLGQGKKEDKKLEPEAARKTAIVTSTNKETGRGANFPPTVPEIQTGGFIPVTPGYGGFKPIPNPHIVLSDNSTATKPTLQSSEASTQATNVSPATVLRSTTPYISLQGSSMGHPLPTPQSEITTTPGAPIKKDTIPKLQTVLEYSTEKGISTSTEKINAEVIKKVHMHSVKELSPNGLNQTSYTKNVSKLEFNAVLNSESFDNLFQEAVDNISIALPTTVLETITEMSSTNPTPKGQGTTQLPKKENAATPLTSLLVPGGQQPHFRPPGRSKITKVISPHASASAPLLSSMQVSDGVVAPYREELITEGSIQTVNEKGSTDTSWYFANYNKTNLQPYVGTSSKCKGLNASNFRMIYIIVLVFTLKFFI